MEQELPDQKSAYELPSTLPPPPEDHSPNVIPAVVFGVAVSVMFGVVLFAISQVIYIYILYNSVIGIGIGMAISQGIKLGHYTNENGLLGLTVLCSILTYLVFNYVMYYWLLRDVQGVRPDFFQFLMLRAEHETLMRGWVPGKIVNIIVWVIEAGITWFFAFKGAMGGALSYQVSAVPTVVTEFVLHHFTEGRSPEEVQQELNRMGWSHEKDREKALAAAMAVVAFIQEENEAS